MQIARPRPYPPSIWLIVTLCSALSVPTLADTLVDIYELALENDALLKSRVAQYRADLELEKLALAPLLPQARAGYTITDSEAETTSPNVYINPETGALDTIDVTSVRNTDPMVMMLACLKRFSICRPGLVGGQGRKRPFRLKRRCQLRSRI